MKILSTWFLAGCAFAVTPAASGAVARVAPAWLTEGVVCRCQTRGAASVDTLPTLKDLGVTVVEIGPSQLSDDGLAAYCTEARRLGLKVIAPYSGCTRSAGPDGFCVRKADAKPPEHWESVRHLLDAERPGRVLIADNSNLRNQFVAFDAEYCPPWPKTLREVRAGKKPLSELSRMWTFMRGNRPHGARIVRFATVRDDPVELALAFALDGVPAVDAGFGTNVRTLVSSLVRLRTGTPALTRGSLAWLETDRPDAVCAFVRQAPDGSQLVCTFNFGREPVAAHVSVPGELAVSAVVADGVEHVTRTGDYAFARRGFDFRWVPSSCAARAAAEARRRPEPGEKVPTEPAYGQIASKAVRPAPDYLRSAVMYQLFLRPFTAGGTFAAAEEMLPHLKDTGVDILYLCPFFEADDDMRPEFWSGRQKGSGLGNPCNPYRIKDYFAVDPEYGTPTDAERFVRAAHRQGMKVFLDLVYYHCGPNAVILKEHPDWIRRLPDGTPDLGEWKFPLLNFDKPELREYLFANMSYLLRRFDVDGFRCDVGDMVPLSYREEAYRRCQAIKQDVVFLCEGSDPRDQFVAFDLCYAFPLQRVLLDLLAGKAKATAVAERYEKDAGIYPKGFRWMHCFENHDISNIAPGGRRHEVKCGGVACEAMLATIFMLDGIPMVYNGQEIADDAPHNIWSNRFYGNQHVNWGRGLAEPGRNRLALVKRLTAIRHENPGLFDASVEFLETGDSAHVYAFRRTLAGGKAFVTAVNVSQETVVARVPPGLRSVLAAKGVAANGSTLSLPPWGWFIGE